MCFALRFGSRDLGSVVYLESSGLVISVFGYKVENRLIFEVIWIPFGFSLVFRLNLG